MVLRMKGPPAAPTAIPTMAPVDSEFEDELEPMLVGLLMTTVVTEPSLPVSVTTAAAILKRLMYSEKRMEVQLPGSSSGPRKMPIVFRLDIRTNSLITEDGGDSKTEE